MIKIGNYQRPLTNHEVMVFNAFTHASNLIRRDFNITPKLKGATVIEIGEMAKRYYFSKKDCEDFFYKVIKGQIDITKNAFAPNEEIQKLVLPAFNCVNIISSKFNYDPKPFPKVLVSYKPLDKDLLGINLDYINTNVIFLRNDKPNYHILQAIIHETFHNCSFGLWGPLDEGVTEFLTILSVMNFANFNREIKQENLKNYLRPLIHYYKEVDSIKLFDDHKLIDPLVSTYFDGNDKTLCEYLGIARWDNIRDLAIQYSILRKNTDNNFVDTIAKILSGIKNS